jgi:uncharacterized protein (UPF0297 family)
MKHKKDRGIKSKYYSFIFNKRISTDQKARIAEAAIFFRFSLFNLIPYISSHSSDKLDFVIRNAEKDQFYKIQVRFVSETKIGASFVNLRVSLGKKGYRPYQKSELDFLIGYDLYTDIAYVYSYDDIKDFKATITIKKEFEEKWEKIIKIIGA